MKVIERFNNTMHMVRFARNSEWLAMQFIDNRTGKRHTYVPDDLPCNYKGIKIICLFHVHLKKVPPFTERFIYYWNFYKN